jgi:V/A-type H+/Na+-transporting ATPase subunit D
MAAKYKLNKVDLTRLRREQKTYQQFLPVLKLKQEQLQAEQLKIRRELDARRADLDAARQGWDSVLPLLSESLVIDLAELVRARELIIGSKTIAGVVVPTLESVRFSDVELSRFGTPAWVSLVLPRLRRYVRLHTEMGIIERQYELVTRELRRTTQKVNLFELVLIPEAKEGIRRIKIALGDLQVAAVGRAKVAKGKATAAAALRQATAAAATGASS